jgi:hypothetical protein
VRFDRRDIIHSHAPVIVEIASLHASPFERSRAVRIAVRPKSARPCAWAAIVSGLSTA